MKSRRRRKKCTREYVHVRSERKRLKQLTLVTRQTEVALIILCCVHYVRWMEIRLYTSMQLGVFCTHDSSTAPVYAAAATALTNLHEQL